ncbi:MAG: DEAD/DEAH box helicase [Bacteroidales bacterium]|nr:DEAD/DEAH box helicase [Bacteroidales bacterium]
MEKQLRDYQVANKEKVFKAWETKQGVMLQMPTGTGKTLLFVSIIKDLLEQQDKPKILILAHRYELIDQIDRQLYEYDIHSGRIVAGGINKKYIPVQIASVQTLSRDKRLEYWKDTAFDYIIVDEAHHIEAKTYKRIIHQFPGSKLLGLTATPYRLSGEGFSHTFQELIESQPVKDFIDQGFLCNYDYYSIPHKELQRQIQSIEIGRNLDFTDIGMFRIMNRRTVLSSIVKTYLKYVNGKKGIVYTVNKDHNSHLCKKFKEFKIRAEAIDSNTEREEREKKVQKFRDGEIDVLCNVNIFSEGFDCPDVDFIMLARPTKSLGLFLQQVGRGLRPGKDKVVFLDIVGSYNSFGFPSLKRNWLHYFNGENRIEPLDESPKGLNEEGRTVFEIDTFDEVEKELQLLETTVTNDVDFNTYLEEVINNHINGPSYEEEYRKYLSELKHPLYSNYRKYSGGTIRNYIPIIPNHIDKFINEKYNGRFESIYSIINPEILIKIRNKLYTDSAFNNHFMQKKDMIKNRLDMYIKFANVHFKVISRTPEDIQRIEEAKKNEEIYANQREVLFNLRDDLFSILNSHASNQQPMPIEILEKIQELQELVNKYK